VSRRIVTATSAIAAGVLLLTGYLVFAPRDDDPRDPDVVVVLGGAGVERTRLGIELANRYDAELVLSSSQIHYGRRLGLECGVHVRCMYPEPETTRGEAMTVGDLAEAEGWNHVTVATSRFHTTRARTLFRQCLGDHVTVVGARPPGGSDVRFIRRLREAAGTIAAWTVQRAC
jgi:uncharacterized SAM-binding protein YcdF (DUF218 family)